MRFTFPFQVFVQSLAHGVECVRVHSGSCFAPHSGLQVLGPAPAVRDRPRSRMSTTTLVYSVKENKTERTEHYHVLGELAHLDALPRNFSRVS